MSKLKITFILAIFLIFSVISTNVYAYTYIDGNPKWSFKSMPVGWMLNANCSADLSFEACEQAQKDSFDTWSNVSCSTMMWRYLGTTSELNHEDWGGWTGKSDGINLMAWQEDSWPNDLDGAIAVTAPIQANGTFRDTDILYNGYDFRWGVNGEWNKMDIAHIATHEIGHAIGLDHSETREATMYYATSSGLTTSRTLHQDDINGICSIYPLGTIDAEVGIPCNNVCEGDAEYFCGWFRGKEMCTHSCNFNADCPDGYLCGYLSTAGFSCWNEGETEFGDNCKDDWDCKKGFVCRSNEDTSICTEMCPTTCPEGFSCSSLVGNEGTACMPTVSQFLGECDPELCAEPYTCEDINGDSYCTKGCTTPLDCPEQSVCTNWNGQNVCWSEENPTRAEIDSFVADKTIVSPLETVIFTAEAHSPNQVMYKFLHQSPDEEFYQIRDYGTNNSYEWLASKFGRHVFEVQVIDSQSLATSDDLRQIIVDVVEDTGVVTDGDDDSIVEDGDQTEPDGDSDTNGGSGGTGGGGGCNSTDKTAPIVLISLLILALFRKPYSFSLRQTDKQ